MTGRDIGRGGGGSRRSHGLAAALCERRVFVVGLVVEGTEVVMTGTTSATATAAAFATTLTATTVLEAATATTAARRALEARVDLDEDLLLLLGARLGRRGLVL